MRTLIRGAFLSGALLSLALLTACGSGNAAPSPTPSTMSDAEILAIGKQVAECIRNNGVPDFPDPFVDKGRLKLPEEVEQTLEQKYSQQVLEQAQQSCQSLMDKLPESAIKGEDEQVGGDRAEPGPGDVEALKKLAQCIREHGIPEWPDPKADGSFPLIGTPLEAEGKSERLGAAFGQCEQHWGGGIRIS